MAAEDAADLWGSQVVPVPISLLREIIDDGTCPLHIRVAVERLLGPQEKYANFDDIGKMAENGEQNEPAKAETSPKVPSLPIEVEPCMLDIAAQLPLAEALALRACSRSCLSWAMRRAAAREGELGKAHVRIRTRLWIQRVADINFGSSDETVYETPVRRLADEALRRRMEGEMADARHDMEQQIRAFQAEVDRRMEQQAARVHAIVEERVQQQIDMILSAEMEKVRTMVEERVQGRMRAVVQREVHATVCEMQVRLQRLAKENDRLRTAFLEHLDHSDLCFRSLVWALSPNATGFFARTLRAVWCCRRRVTQLSAWMLGVPDERRRVHQSAVREALNDRNNSNSADWTPTSAARRAQTTAGLLTAVGISPAAAAAIVAAAAVSANQRRNRELVSIQENAVNVEEESLQTEEVPNGQHIDNDGEGEEALGRDQSQISDSNANASQVAPYPRGLEALAPWLAPLVALSSSARQLRPDDSSAGNPAARQDVEGRADALHVHNADSSSESAQAAWHAEQTFNVSGAGGRTASAPNQMDQLDFEEEDPETMAATAIVTAAAEALAAWQSELRRGGVGLESGWTAGRANGGSPVESPAASDVEETQDETQIFDPGVNGTIGSEMPPATEGYVDGDDALPVESPIISDAEPQQPLQEETPSNSSTRAGRWWGWRSSGSAHDAQVLNEPQSRSDTETEDSRMEKDLHGRRNRTVESRRVPDVPMEEDEEVLHGGQLRQEATSDDDGASSCRGRFLIAQPDSDSDDDFDLICVRKSFAGNESLHSGDSEVEYQDVEEVDEGDGQGSSDAQGSRIEEESNTTERSGLGSATVSDQVLDGTELGNVSDSQGDASPVSNFEDCSEAEETQGTQRSGSMAEFSEVCEREGET